MLRLGKSVAPSRLDGRIMLVASFVALITMDIVVTEHPIVILGARAYADVHPGEL